MKCCIKYQQVPVPCLWWDDNTMRGGGRHGDMRHGDMDPAPPMGTQTEQSPVQWNSAAQMDLLA